MSPSAQTWFFLGAIALGSVLGLGALLGGEAPSVDGDFVSLEGDASAPLDADLEAEGHGPSDGADADDASPDGWLTMLGVGRVPLGLLLSLDLMLLGGVGLVVGELTAGLGRGSASLLTLAVACVVGPALGARLARGVSRWAPSVESHGASRSSLVGRLGRAELEIDAGFGRARVVDAGGAVHLVRCTSGEHAIEAGSELVVVAHDAKTGIYRVERTERLFENPSTETKS